VNILIVEDEVPSARRLKRLVGSILAESLQSIEVAHSLAEAQTHVEFNKIDLIFLDLDLSGEDGFRVLQECERDFQTIVVSANTHRAIQAFDNEVVDFVPKPIDELRLLRAIDRISKNDKGNRIVVKSIGETEIVALQDIVSISGAGDYVEIQLENGRKLLHYDSLDHLESTLPKVFLRTHRSHIVNLGFATILGKDAEDHSTLATKIGTEVPVSRRKTAAVKKALSDS
jgi:two-component system response regulator LytT